MNKSNRVKTSPATAVKGTMIQPQSMPMTKSIPTDLNIEGLRHEYSEVNNNVRHYSNQCYAIFTVFFAILGGLIAVAFGFFESKTGNSDIIKLWARVGGLLVTILFWSIEINCEKYLKVYVEVAKDIEGKLGYKQITERESRTSLGKLKPSYAPSMIYGVLVAFWVVMIIWIASVIARA